MTCPEDAAELRVEHVLCHHPGTEEFRVKVNMILSTHAIIYLKVKEEFRSVSLVTVCRCSFKLFYKQVV